MPEAITVDTPAPTGRAPTLYIIIGMKLLKGLFFSFLAYSAYRLSDNDLPAEYQKLLSWINHFKWIHLNPEKKFWVDLAGTVGDLTEVQMLRVAMGTLIYSLFSWVEGLGMIFRVPWAGWLAIGESAFFIPIEVLELVHHFSVVVSIILVLNVAIVWYLLQNRDRLFHHHK